MTDAADEAERVVEENDAAGLAVPSGQAPCRCGIEPDGERLTACERADREGLPRPAGCRRKPRVTEGGRE